MPKARIMNGGQILHGLMCMSSVCSKCTYLIGFCFSTLQICPRIASQKSLQRFVYSPPSSHSTFTTTASSASQKPSLICRCWLILTSGWFFLTLYFQFAMYIQYVFSFISLKRCLFPFQCTNRAKMLTIKRDISSFAETQFPIIGFSLLTCFCVLF